MKALRIEVAPFDFTDILDVNIQKGVNMLGSARIKGVIDEEKEKEYVQKSLRETSVEITAEDFQGNRKTIFQGVLENLNISSVNSLKIMELTVMPYSKLLDINPCVCVFQNENLKYNEMISAVIATFKDSDAILHCGDGQAIGQMFVQYQETPWAYIIRMASMFEDVVFADDTKKGAKLHFGFLCKHFSNPVPINPISYDMRKNIAGYLAKEKISERKHKESDASSIPFIDMSVREDDFVYYVAKDREIRELGESVAFLEQMLYVTEVVSVMEGGELVHQYTLKKRGGIWVQPYRNFAIVGASLSGQVSAVTGSHVKMSLPTAHSNNAETSKWHNFSTVYSSPDGTGWYAMPEKGDSLRLYFPTEIENDGYTISAVHKYGVPQTSGMAAKATAASKTQTTVGANNADAVSDDALDEPLPEQINSERFNAIMNSIGNREVHDRAMAVAELDPNNKFMQNDSGKFVMLTPTAIMMASGGGVILIEDDYGITICSNSDVFIEGWNITVAAKKQIAVIGDKKVTVQQDSAEAELADGNIRFKAAEIKTI